MREAEEDAGPGARDIAAPAQVSGRDGDDAKKLMPTASRSIGNGGGTGAGERAPLAASDEESGGPPPNDCGGAGIDGFEGEFYTLDDALDRCGKAGWFQLGMLGFTGLSWAVDAMEVAILTYLASAAKCEWGLTTVQESLLTSAVFAGMCVGAPVWGAVSDARGRKFAFGLGMLFTCVFGFSSAAAPNFQALMAFRALVGFGIPSACVAFNWLGECCPASTRGLFLVGIEGFWTIGTVAQALLAFGLLNRFGWRVMLTVSAVPTFILLVLIPFVPESPRWLATKGRTDEAEAVLKRIVRFCGKAPPPGRLHPLPIPAERARPAAGSSALTNLAWRAKGLASSVTEGIRGLFSRSLWLTTIVLVFVWMSSAHVYYGLSYLVGQISFMSGGSKTCEAALGGRLQIPTADLQANLITACAEVPGLVLSLLLVHLCSRRVAFAAPMSAIAVVLVPLMAGVTGAGAIPPLFLARMFIYAAFAIVWTTAETYPTSVRGFALGFNNSMSRIGGMLSSFTVAARQTAWAHTPEAVFFALSLASAAALMLLPQPDAKGAHLADTVEDVEERQRLEAEEAAAAGRSNSVLSRAFGSAAARSSITGGRPGGGGAQGGSQLVARRKPSAAQAASSRAAAPSWAGGGPGAVYATCDGGGDGGGGGGGD